MEVIVIDDGSTDHTRQMLKRYFPDVLYFHQSNQGVSTARNTGIKMAKGKWIAFLDSDDRWKLQKLEKQMTALQNSSDIKICHTNEIWIRNGEFVNQKKKHRKFGGYIYQKCLPLCRISPSAVIIHRSIFEDIGLFDESLPACEDYDLWLRMCSKYPVLYLEQKLIYKYGGHADQLSQTFWGMDRFRIQALEKIIEQETLTPEQKQVTLKTLLKKLRIYTNGAKKRNKTEETAILKGKIRHYQTLLEI